MATISAKSEFQTIGYEGIPIETFLRRVGEYGIENIIDIRANPISRKPGFSKTALRKHLQTVGVEYVHFPLLGIPSRIRRQYHNISELLDYYEDSILPHFLDEAEKVVRLCEEKNSALLCFEENPNECHRSRLARWIQKNYPLTARYH